MDLIYTITVGLAFVAWTLLLAYCSPGLFRIVRGGLARSDLLSVLLSAMAFNQVGFSAVRYLFWQPESIPEAEQLARAILSVLSVVCVVLAIAILHQYRRRESF